MADYGVPEDLAGVLPWAWAEERLVANRNYWLVTAGASGRPASMPLWGVWLTDEERFWCGCSPNSRKVRNLRANPRCVVTVEDTVECVSVEGTGRVLDPGSREPGAEAAIAAWVTKYFPDPAGHDEATEFMRSHTLVEVTPEVAFGIIERVDEFSRRATRWRW